MNVCVSMHEIVRFEFSHLTPLEFFFVGLDEERSFKKKDGYRRIIAGSHSGCCC